MKIRTGTGAVLPILLVLSACATGRGAQGSGEETIAVQVNNNLVPSTTVSVSAITEQGVRTLLGSVLPGAEQVFTFRPMSEFGAYHLVADPPGPGGVIVSRSLPISPAPTAAVEWRLSTNHVVFQP